MEKPYLDAEGTLCIPISPENEPVNSSPWYAFRISAEEHMTLKIRLVYPGAYGHRYDPKWSGDRKIWHALSGENRKQTYDFHLDLGNKPLYVAAQPLLTSSDINEWIQNLTGLAPKFGGKTVLGRAIPYFTFGNTQAQRHLLFLGRQHPPEVTGHKALLAFVEELYQDTWIKENYSVLVLPLVNPDGVTGVTMPAG